MPELMASGIAVSFGDRVLFRDVSIALERGHRVAVVGPNGAGKTTLLRTVSGNQSIDAGQVVVPEHVRVALHDQRPERSDTLVRDYVAPQHMVELENRLRELELKMADGSESALSEYAAVRERFDHGGGEGWATWRDQVLRGLGFSEEQFEQQLQTLSGGELTRVSLARVLAARPDVLLLDEPTNHLDIEAITWLQDFLADFGGACMLVSHDRWFIEAACNRVLEIAAGRARLFTGSFVEYRAQQALEASTHQGQVESWQREVARLQRFVDKFSAGTRSRQAQSKQKTLARLRQQVPAYADLRDRKRIGFRLPKPERSARVVVDARSVTLAVPTPDGAERTLLSSGDLVVEQGQKLALLGRNGTGKSTLLESVAAACVRDFERPEAMRGGEIRVGHSVSARFVSQHDAELRDNASLVGNLQAFAPNLSRGDALSLLGIFGFTGSDGDRLVGGLSGGERRRVLLAAALSGSANLLLLDEPTNHLDIETCEALEQALDEYEGAVILISHDRALVEGVADHVAVLYEQKLTPVLGGYAAAQELVSGTAPPVGKNAPENSPPIRQKPATHGARKVRRREPRPRTPRTRKPDTIEQEIEQLEARLAQVDQHMLDPEVYMSRDRSTDALDERARIERDIKRRYEELEKVLEQ